MLVSIGIIAIIGHQKIHIGIVRCLINIIGVYMYGSDKIRDLLNSMDNVVKTSQTIEASNAVTTRTLNKHKASRKTIRKLL
ncbi:hypothetical protein TSAR_003544 [Trichomalopsis sarcophagae]|uniref:Uncharacterized protein n=1 Tax=Trichomalopsis sarcophagae TaxID=543379 RepID=A0A232FF70_9HYME|nr:hypothetical protein TSAR_003544 [Trichomalopsis sarcophagae]